MIGGYSPVIVQKVGAYHFKLQVPFMTPHCMVPVGFVTDGVTNKRILWSVINPAGRFFEAAIVHDYMLSQPHYRRKAHKAFYQTALDYGAKRFVAKAAYYAVVLYDKFFL